MKGMILAAGYGSRFLPATKTIPKEMLPLIDKPAIEFIIDEFVESGIKEILIVTSRRKKPLEDFLDREIELETTLPEDKLSHLKDYNSLGVKIYFIRQPRMGGTGNAVQFGEGFMDTPFILAFPDDLVFSKVPLSRQMIDIYNETQKNILAVMDMSGEDVSPYGVVNPSSSTLSSSFEISGLVEKPEPGDEPSSMVSIGRYLLTPEIFTALNKTSAGVDIDHQEFYLTDALNLLSKENKVVAYNFEGDRYDTGTPLGFLEAVNAYALSREDIADQYKVLVKKQFGYF